MHDCIIVGGGIAGLQAAVQLGRYNHQVLVIDKGEGRSTLCSAYHNLLGWPDGVAGPELLRLGRLQGERLGVRFMDGEVISAAQDAEGFEVALQGGGTIRGRTILMATGVSDRYPELPGLVERFGHSIYVCPDCDGYEGEHRTVLVLGSGQPGCSMALALRYWTERVLYINHEKQMVGSEGLHQLKEAGITYIEEEIAEVLGGSGGGYSFGGVRLRDGRVISGDKGFIAFGGNTVATDWAVPLGIERLENKHVVTDPRSKMTSVRGVWAAGDVGVHAEQASIAMGEGSQAAIWIHKELMKHRRAGSS